MNEKKPDEKNNRAHIISMTIQTIEQQLEQIHEIYLERQGFMTTDISYLDRVYKQLTITIGVFNENFTHEYTSCRMMEQSAGHMSSHFRVTLHDLHGVLEEGLTKLHSQHGILVQRSNQYSNSVGTKLTNLKQAFQAFHEKCVKLRREAIGPDNVFILGTQLDEEYAKMVAIVTQFETDITTEINSSDALLENSTKIDEDVIQSVSDSITHGFLFLGSIPTHHREIEPKSTVAYYHQKIQTQLFSLKNTFGPPSSTPGEICSGSWLTDALFYARVWEDYQPRNDEELTLIRGEMVQVTKVPLHGHWHATRTNGQVGYAPCSILEPLS